MSVKSIECQIATSQIGRYLSGDAFSPEALKQLEAHIGECPECKASLVQRRAILQAMLNGSSAVAEVTIAEDAPKNVSGALHELFGAKNPRPTPTPAPAETATKASASHFWKPFAMCLALAGVLMLVRVYGNSLGNTVIPAQPPTTSDSKPTELAKTAPVTAPPAAVTTTTTTTAIDPTATTTTPATTSTAPTQTAAVTPTPVTTPNLKPAPTSASTQKIDYVKPVPPDSAQAAGNDDATADEASPSPAHTTTPKTHKRVKHAKKAKSARAKAKHRARRAKAAPVAAESTAIRVYDSAGHLISK